MQLGRADSWEALSTLFYANHHLLDFINISTFWTRLAHLYGHAGTTPGAWQGANHHPAVDPGLQLPLSPQHLDHLAHPQLHAADTLPGHAATGHLLPPVHDGRFRQFLSELIAATSLQLQSFGVQALANVMWAMSYADWRLEEHQPAVDHFMQRWCAAVGRRVGELCPPDVANISTAIGRLDQCWHPKFVVAFYRSVLQRDDLLDGVDARTLNSLLFGIARARRRGLMRVGPSTMSRLSLCVSDLLSRADSRSANLEPWRAAQLLYNCQKLQLRLSSRTYGALMAEVAKLHAAAQAGPCSLDRWSFAYLVGYVDAFRMVRPRLRPNLQPLYAYVERRLGEGTTSQLAMVSHLFSEMGYPPAPSLWRHVFVRYMGPAYVHVHMGQGGAQAHVGHGRGEQGQGQGQAGGEQAEGQEGGVEAQGRDVRRARGESGGAGPGRQDGAGQRQQPEQQQREQAAYSAQHLFLSSEEEEEHQPAAAGSAEAACRALQGQHARGGSALHGRASDAAGRDDGVQGGQQAEFRPGHARGGSSGQRGTRQWCELSVRPTYHPPEVEQQSGGQQQQPDEAQGEQAQQAGREEQGLLHDSRSSSDAPAPSVQQSPGRSRSAAAAAAAAAAIIAARPDDDAVEARTLHYVCWQAAKSGVLPPRIFLRLYLERVPDWVADGPRDVQLAQVAETFKLLPWLPRGRLRSVLVAQLLRRDEGSRLPLRTMARWLQEQR